MYAADLAAFGIYLVAGSVSNAPVMAASSVVGLGLSSYLVAKIPTRQQLESQHNQKLIEAYSEVSKLQAEKEWLESLNASQSQKLTEAHKQELESLQERLAAMQGQLEQQQRQREEAIANLNRERERALAQITATHQRERASIKAEADEEIAQREERIAALELHIDVLTSRMAEVESRARKLGEVEALLKKEAQEVALAQKSLAIEEKRVRLDIKVERDQLKKQLDGAVVEIQARDVLIAKLKASVEELKQQNQQLFDELYGSKNSQVSDELVNQIQSLLAQHELKTEFLSRENRGGVDFIYLKPETLWKQSTLDTVAQVLPGLVDIPQPEISAKNGRIEVKIDNRSMLDKIQDAPANWLEKLYLDAKHNGKNLAILGARGGGKTELAKNYIGLVLSHEPDAEVIYIQPKVDDYAVFEVAGRVIEPQYIGFEPITSNQGKHFPSAYDGILYLRDLYTKRNAINQQHFADGKPSPKFKKVFFLVDELQVAISREREFIDPEVIKAESLRNGQTFCGKIIRDAISLGRSLGIVVLALGQLPNVSVYGWTKHDLYQYIVLFMAANAPQALDYAPTKEEKRRIESELDLWRKRASMDVKKSFYCYVRPMDKAGYLALLPEPGKYLDNADNRQGADSSLEALPSKDYPLVRIADNHLLEADNPAPLEADNEGESDEEMMLKIQQFWESGERRLTSIIPALWGCEPGSRAYRKAREEYKRITGE